MTIITEDLIRKRAEHNNCEISTLEEVSLHQQDIERIEYIDKWCRELKILYLQSNLIPKIENVGRLKKLEYLNLALNNIERVENLENCESLRKLDLTVNFIGELTSIECLQELYNFSELFLTGNPCTEYEGYRDYVLATLPQLQRLDGSEIQKSERIAALQVYDKTKEKIIKQQGEYRKKREREKEEEKLKEEKKKKSGKPGFDGRWYTDINNTSEKTQPDEEGDGPLKTEHDQYMDDEKEFWEEKTKYTPESRMKVHQHMKEVRKREEQKTKNGPDPPKRERRLEDDNGRILNVNEAKVDFTLTEDDSNVVLDVAVFRHLDTSLCDVDVQTTYIKVTLKGKVLQLTLPEEVKPDSSTAQRSTTTGHLVIIMPKVNPVIRLNEKQHDSEECSRKRNNKFNSSNKENNNSQINSSCRHEKLEVDPTKQTSVNLGGIVQDTVEKTVPPLEGSRTLAKSVPERANSQDFVDNPDVPPLI